MLSLCSALDGHPKKGLKEKGQLGDRSPTKKHSVQVPLALEAPLKTLKYRFRFSFCLGERENRGSGWVLVKFNYQQNHLCNSRAGQKYERDVLGYG